MTYVLSRDRRRQTGHQQTEFRRTGIHDLRPVEGSEKANRHQQLNSAGQESMTYDLSRDRRRQTGHQQTEFRRTGIQDLPTVEDRRRQTGHQQTEFRRTGIQDLRPVEGSEKANQASADRIPQDRNPGLTFCRGIGEGKPGISRPNSAGQESMTYDLSRIGEGKPGISRPNSAGQESMTYDLSRDRRRQTGHQQTEFRRTGIHDLRAVEGSEKANRASADRIPQDRNP